METTLETIYSFALAFIMILLVLKTLNVSTDDNVSFFIITAACYIISYGFAKALFKYLNKE